MEEIEREAFFPGVDAKTPKIKKRERERETKIRENNIKKFDLRNNLDLETFLKKLQSFLWNTQETRYYSGSSSQITEPRVQCFQVPQQYIITQDLIVITQD